MKKSKVRFLALMLALCLLVSVFPMPTLALDNYDNDLEENLLAGNENCSIDQSIDTNSNDTGNSSQANVSQESYSEDDYSNDVNSIIDSVPAENIEEKSDLPQVCNQEDEIEIFSGSGAEVSTGHQLSKLYFKNSFTSESSFYEMQPAFDPETKEHNVIIPDSVHPSQNFAIWATLAETASGDITVQYVKSDGKQSPEIQITSGDEYGTSIPKPFKQNSLIGNSLTFKVGGEEAYIVNIIRKATLKGLTLSDQTGTEIELSPTFDGSTYSYSAEIPSDAVLSVTATATASEANISVGGKATSTGASVEIVPTWTSDDTCELVITVGGENAQSSTYTVSFHKKMPPIESMEILQNPAKMVYRVGEIFDPTGIELKVTFKDTSTKIINCNDISYTPTLPLSKDSLVVTITYGDATTTLPITVLKNLSGEGSKESPFLIKSIADLETIRTEVSQGNSFEGKFFRLENSLEITNDWIPIGSLKSGASSTAQGANILPFSGTIDGANNTISFESGSKPLFNYVREAKVQNLVIYAPFMDGYALVDCYTVDYGADGDYNLGAGGSYIAGCPDTIDIENVAIKSGSIIKKGGFIGGFASGGNTVNIVRCTIESGVKIGCNADGSSANQSQVGSLAGMFNGTVQNCVSYADVYGTNNIGGLIGYKGQSMGPCSVTNSEFYGTVNASGNNVGGIIGSGYSASSAPNTPCVTIEGCVVSCQITGSDYVGGILGAEKVVQCWDNGIGYIRNNKFTGKIEATSGNYVGGIIGYMRSLNRYTIIENNFYTASNNIASGIGGVQYIDTNCETHESASDAIYINTEKGVSQCPAISGCDWRENHHRTDDPLGADSATLCYTDDVGITVKTLSVSGDFKTEYLVGEHFDATGIKLTAIWSDNSVTHPDISEATISSFDSTTPGRKTIIVKYKSASTSFTVNVIPEPQKITLSVTVMGDSHHSDPTSNGGPHGLARGGLTTWASVSSLEADATETVWDVIQRVAKSNNLSIQASFSEKYNSYYIKAVNGLGEFDNGKKSGWMYTVNGTHPNVGVSARYVKDQDVIILHYTDDYTYEQGGVNYGKPVGQVAAEAVDKLIEAIGTVSFTDACKAKIDAARKAYDALSESEKKLVKKLSTLEAAEKKYAELKKADDQKKATAVDNLIAAIGTVTKNSGTKINAAWNAYNALTADQKALVKKLATLQSATSTWNDLMAKEVIDLIDKIDDPVTESSEKAIKDARTAYDKLTNAQKKLVTNYEKLTKAETELAKLVATEDDKDVTKVGTHNLLAGLNSMDYIKKQGNNGPIWALIALDSGNYPVPEGDVTRQALIDEILRVQTSDGGWAISGDEADADMTGMALTALARYYKKDLRVLAAVDKAIECLSQMQDADGGFSTFSGNGGKVATSESTAQVVVALTALGINPDTDARFVKNGHSAIDALVSYFVNGGGFKHVSNGQLDGMATEQAYYALTAYYRFLEEKTSLYDMTDVIDMGGDPEEVVEETTEPTVPATTEPVEAENGGSFPWAIMVLVLAAGFGGGIATVTLILPRIKKKRF